MLPQFDVSTYASQVFWLFISFSIVLIGLVFLVLPKYQKILEARIYKIKTEVDTAVYLQKEVIKLKRERIQRISQAEEESKNEVEAAEKKIVLSQIDHIKKAKKEHEEMIAKLERSIAQQKETILENIKPFIEHSSTEILEKLKDMKHAS